MNACTAGYEEMNTNPDKVTDDMLDMDNLRTGGSISAMQLDIIPCSDEGANAFQRAQNLVGDIFPDTCLVATTGTALPIIRLTIFASEGGVMCFSLSHIRT